MSNILHKRDCIQKKSSLTKIRLIDILLKIDKENSEKVSLSKNKKMEEDKLIEEKKISLENYQPKKDTEESQVTNSKSKIKTKLIQNSKNKISLPILKYNVEEKTRIKNEISEKRISSKKQSNISLFFSKKESEKYGCIYENNFLRKKRKKRFKLLYFNDVCKILSSFSKGKILSILNFDLEPQKQEILLKILVNQHKTIISPELRKSLESSESSFTEKYNIFTDFYINNSMNKSIKRLEEEMKFVFKTTLKRMKIKFYQENNLKLSKKKINFYHHFFDKVKYKNIFNKIFCEKTNEPIRLVNKKILFCYFLSNKFKEEFFSFLNNQFENVYLKSIFKKWETFFKKYEKKYFTLDECCKNIDIHINKTNKIKYPWNIIEIKNSIETFHKIVSKL